MERSLKALIFDVDRNMGPAAEVGEIALLVDRDRVVVRELVDQLDLVGLASVLKERQGIGLGNIFLGDRRCRFGQLRHLLFDLYEILRRKGTLEIEVVVEPFFDRGTDGKLCLRKELLYRMRHEVRSTVPVHFAAFRRVEGNDLYRGVVINRDVEILKLTV